jgi:hypothetical protein
MSDVLKFIATIVCGGGALGVIGLCILYLTKAAITTAIAQAGAKELVYLRGEIDAQLAAKRHEFERALETFKSELSLGAEVRRQVAARKVDVLERVIALGMSAVRRVGEEAERKLFWEELTALGTALHGAKHLFRAEVAKKLIEYYANIAVFEHDVKHNFKADLFKKMTADTENFIALARSELYVEPLEVSEQTGGEK